MGRLQASIYNAIAPNEDLLASEWADKKFYLSKKSSAEHGKYYIDRTPFHAGIVNAPFEENIKETWVMASAQWGKTTSELIILGYMAEMKPIPLLWVAPTLQMAEATSTDRVAPMFEDCPSLRPLLRSARSRDSGNRILHKELTNGMVIDFAGSNSEASLASRPKGAVIFDELDKFPDEAGKGGDPVLQAVKRTITYGDRAIIIGVSTPSILGKSRIEKAFLTSDQRHFHVPCPHCGFEQDLVWESLLYTGKGTDSFDLSDLAYYCRGCGGAIPEKAKPEMIEQGDWVKHSTSEGIAGFHLWEAYSPWVWWADICLNYQASYKDAMTFRTWKNLSLGLPCEEDDRTKYDWENLLNRAEKSDYSMGSVPEGALFLTAGVDVQGNRLECAVFGWGEGEECWLIDYQIFMGEPIEDEPWQALADFLEKDYPHPLGGLIRVKMTCVDTGYLDQECYRQILKRRNWRAIKGKDGDRALVSAPSLQDVNYRGKKLKNGIRLYTIGVDSGKAILLNRAKLEREGPKYLHVPQDITQFWAEGFAGSEVQIQKHRNGRPYLAWEQVSGVRNEPLDTAVYAYAAASLAGVTRQSNWAKIRKSLTVEPVKIEEEIVTIPDETKPTVEVKPRRVRRAISEDNFANNY